MQAQPFGILLLALMPAFPRALTDEAPQKSLAQLVVSQRYEELGWRSRDAVLREVAQKPEDCVRTLVYVKALDGEDASHQRGTL